MRQVEKKLIKLLRENRTGKASANTAVSAHPSNPSHLAVTLHGNTIAVYQPFTTGGGWRLMLSDCGWQTVTTKSRLNAILDAFAPGYGIRQENYVWYLIRPNGDETPWAGSAAFDQQGCVSDD